MLWLAAGADLRLSGLTVLNAIVVAAGSTAFCLYLLRFWRQPQVLFDVYSERISLRIRQFLKNVESCFTRDTGTYLGTVQRGVFLRFLVPHTGEI